MFLLVQIRRPLERFPSTCVQQEKNSNTRQKLTKGEPSPSQNGCWNILFFFPFVLSVTVNPLCFLTRFRNRKGWNLLSGKVYQLSLLSGSMFFPPLLLVGFFGQRHFFVKIQQIPKKKKKSSGLVQKLCWPVDVSVEWAEGQSERCHSSLLSPVWVCSLGTGTTRATAANKGPLSGSACCTQWHQLSPPTSSSKHTMRGRETANTHTYTHKPFPRRIQTTTTHHHPNLLPKYEESCRGLLIKV